MTQVVNLRQARKRRERAEARKAADENAARHGLAKAERARQEAEAKAARRKLDGHERE